MSQVGFDLIAYKGRPECLFLGEKKLFMKNDYKDVFKCIYFWRGKRKLSCVRFCAGILVVINKQSADRLQTPPPPMSELGLTIAIFNKKVSQVGFDLICRNNLE